MFFYHTGSYFQDRDRIESCFNSFYTNLWDDTNSILLNDLMDALLSDHKTLASSDSLLLTRDATKVEVFHTMMSLSLGKIPEPDGFNVEFYRTFWYVLVTVLLRQ